MPKLSLKSGTTSKMLNMFVQDSSKTTGAGLAGLSNNSSGLLAHYIREGESASNPIAIVSAAIGTWTTGGFIEIESSAMPGLYQIGLPNAVCSANAKSATLYYFGATNMSPVLMEIELTATDNQDGVRYGMTALPNAAAAASNGLPTAGAGAFQISTSAGMVLVQQGAAAGQLDATSGVVKANVTQTLGVTIPASAGYMAVDWGTIVNKTTTNALTGTTISTSQVAASVTGAVGSVTGAVGSVTAGVAVASVSSGILPPNFVSLSIDAGGNVKTQTAIKKNVIVSGFSFVMTDNTTHVPRAGLTVSANRSIDGAAFAACTNNVTEISNGIYQTNLAAADVNGNNIMLRFVAVSADDQNLLVITNS